MDSQSSEVQQVTKASSDKLLSKFAELDSSDSPRKSSSGKLQLIRGPVGRKRRSSRRGFATTTHVASSSSSSSYRRDFSQPTKKMKLAERKSLLLPTTSRRCSPTIMRPVVRAREIYAGFMMAAFEKAWRKTVEGASRIIVERHCSSSSHVRLISDAV